LALLALALVVAMGGACRRRVATTTARPPAPPPPNYLALADAAYAARNYAPAAEAYEQFLKASPLAAERDRALYRVAMSYFVRESPLYDEARALEAFRQLAASLPASPYAAEANLYLTLHGEIATQLQALAERSRRIEELSAELARLKLDDGKKAEELVKLKGEAARREERIKQISSDLDRLKAIDMQRKPAQPRR
jgi:tetratricopeptide (TPR) repeat protein